MIHRLARWLTSYNAGMIYIITMSGACGWTLIETIRLVAGRMN